jgi:hypothetical protein
MSMILQTSATDLGAAGKDNTYGAGKLNCLGAVQAALALSTSGEVGGVVTDVTNQAPIGGVLVEAIGEPESATTNGQGQYSIVIPAGSYTLRFTHANYVEEQAPVTVLAGSTVTLDVEMAPVAAGVGSEAGASLLHPVLEQNQPNPFNPVTAIRFQVPATGPAHLAVFDVSGRLVRTLKAGIATAGAHEVTWDGRDDRGAQAPTGIYVYQLAAGGTTRTRSMVLLK